MRSTLIIALTIFTLQGAWSQNRIQQQIDSLLQVAKSADDSTKLAILNRVGFHYVFNDLPKSKVYIDSALTIAEAVQHDYWRAALHNTKGIYHDISGQSDSAKFYFSKALSIAKAYNIDAIQANATNNLGMFHWNRSEYKEALSYFFKSLERSRAKEEEQETRASLSNIGLIYQDMKLYDKALSYHEEALALRRKYNKLNELPISLNNMAITLKAMNRLEEALPYVQEAVEVSQKQQMTREYLSALTTEGTILYQMDDLEKAEATLQMAIEKRNETNIDRKANLPNISNLLAIYNVQNNYAKANEYVVMGNDLLSEFPELENAAVEFYQEATKAAFAKGDISLGGDLFEKTLALKDSVFSSNNAEEIAALETEFKVAENERDLAQTRANLAESELEVRRKNTLIYGGFGLALVLGVLGYLFYSQQKLKNSQLQKESELQTALAKIETQNKLQEQRLRISRDLHDTIGSQLTFVTSSVDNLKYALEQNKPVTSEKLGRISEFTTETIYELRDTIWAMNKTEITAEEVQIRIANFIEKAGVARENTNFSFDVDPKIATMTFSSIQGMNIYRIIQEAINNALKHANANAIAVQIKAMSSAQEQKNDIQLSIEDNGTGFDEKQMEAGNGLANIRKRAKDLGGSATVISNQGEGTTIQVNF